MLIKRYFKQVPFFKETYEVSVLKKNNKKYNHLIVEEPLIKLAIPIPYLSQPL